jgi:hypothetical protein
VNAASVLLGVRGAAYELLCEYCLIWLRVVRQTAPSSSTGKVKILSSASSRPALGPSQAPISWSPKAPSPGFRRLEREADHPSQEPESTSHVRTPPWLSA